MARRLLTDPAPELRTSFEDLMLKNGQFRWNRLENLMQESSKSQVRGRAGLIMCCSDHVLQRVEGGGA